MFHTPCPPQLLPAVTSPTRAPETDICRMPPTNCGPNGRLRKLVLAGVGLDCGDQGLPPSFADLDELETLDMAYNKIGGTTAALADLVQQVRITWWGDAGCCLPACCILWPVVALTRPLGASQRVFS
jgi:hypothetical protein